jgi:hypothetical protein
MHWQWCGCRISRPAEQYHRPEAVDMVGVEMRQEEPLNLSIWYPHQRYIPRSALSRIDHHNPLAGNYDAAGPCTFTIGQWRTGAAKRNMQAVGYCGDCISANSALCTAVKNRSTDLGPEMVKN